jgi:hypothetical protein
MKASSNVGVLVNRDRLHMGRIDARRIPAQMVNDESRRNRTNLGLISQSVSQNLLAVYIDPAVSIFVPISGPHEAITHLANTTTEFGVHGH